MCGFLWTPSQMNVRRVRSSAVARSAEPGNCRCKSCCHCMSAALNVTKTGDVLGKRKRAWAWRPWLLFLQNGRVPVRCDSTLAYDLWQEALVGQQDFRQLLAAEILETRRFRDVKARRAVRLSTHQDVED